MSRNDIFSTSFRALPPKLNYARDSTPTTTTHPSNIPDPSDPFAPSSSSSLNRSRTTGQSWLRSTRSSRDPPPAPLRLHHSRSVHIADKPSVYVFPDLDDLDLDREGGEGERPISPPGSSEGEDARTAGRPSVDFGSETALGQDVTPLAPGLGPSRTSSFFDLPSSRLAPAPPAPPPATRGLTSSSSDFSSAYSTRSNPALMEELPWEGGGVGRVQEEEAAGMGEGVRLRLREERRFFLGEGRFAKVWVAAFRKRRSSPSSDSDSDPSLPRRTRWRLCAAKRPLPDPESELLVRREAFFLRHLSSPPAGPSDEFAQGRRYIIRLLGVVREGDEEDEGELTVHTGMPPPLPLQIPQADGLGAGWKRPVLTSQTTISPTTATPEPLSPHTPPHLRHLRPASTTDHLVSPAASPTTASPNALRHVRSVSDTFSSSLLSPTPHAPRAVRSRPSSPTRAWGALPPTPTSPALFPHHHQQPHPPAHPPRLTLLLSYHPLGSLSHLLHTSPHLLTPALYTSLAHQLSLALAYAHSRGVLHTDIKPQNVLVGPGSEARLADFGSALLLPPYARSAPSDGLGLGTPGYTAPELLLPPHSSTFTYSADIFSLGVLLGVLLFGREPYAGLVGRGRGRGEMMHWARRGEYWMFEEGVRLEGVGGTRGEGERRVVQREEGSEDEDGGRRLGREDLEELLRDDDEDDDDSDEDEDVHMSSSPPLPPHPFPTYTQRRPTPLPSPPSSPPRTAPTPTPPSPSAPYPDGSPPIYFLGGGPPRARAPDELVGLVKRMCAPRAGERPGMGEVVDVLGRLRGVYNQEEGAI